MLDQAHEYFTRAVKADPADASSYEALARIWRDWGTAHLGLADAHRAVHYAPESPSAANTLGTVLQALGYTAEAKGWYGRALALEDRPARDDDVTPLSPLELVLAIFSLAASTLATRSGLLLIGGLGSLAWLTRRRT